MDSLTQSPIEKGQSHLQRWALILMFLMAIMSIIGLIWPQSLYPDQAQVDAYFINDLINLIVGLPGVILALVLIKRNKLLGLLFLPGAMLFIFYTYIAYLFGADFSGWSVAWGILAIGSGFLFFRLLLNLNAVVLKNCLKGRVPVLFSGIVLALFGAAFGFLAFDILSTQPLSLPHPDLGLAIADITVSLLWLGCGIVLCLKKPVGYAWGLALLYTGVLLFIGVILIVILQPWLTSQPFVMEDLVVLASMALICFIPFGLFVRGVLKKN